MTNTPPLPLPDSAQTTAAATTPLPEILNMGGYGMYIWPCYGLMFILLAMMAFTFWRDRRLAYRGLKLERDYREKRRNERTAS